MRIKQPLITILCLGASSCGGQFDERAAGVELDPAPIATTADAACAGGYHKPKRRVWPRIEWQWQLEGRLDASVDVALYDVDLFDVSEREISKLKSKGRTVICYFSAGSREDWRADADDFRESDYRWRVSGWHGERWLDTRSPRVRRIMRARLDLAKKKGCDGVEPDNVDGYDNSTGFDLVREDQVDYNLFLSAEAHVRGLSVGLKNAPDLARELEPHFDWALSEECLRYDECREFRRFLEAGKAVLHVEYVNSHGEGRSRKREICGDWNRRGFSTLIKKWNVDAWHFPCD